MGGLLAVVQIFHSQDTVDDGLDDPSGAEQLFEVWISDVACYRTGRSPQHLVELLLHLAGRFTDRSH